MRALFSLLLLANILHAEVPDIDAKTRSRLGIVTADLAETELPPTIPATATVLDPAPLVALLRQAETAAQNVGFSEKSLARSEKLSAGGHLVPEKDVDAARAKLLTDKAAHRAILDSILSTYGEPSISFADPGELLKPGKVALVRLSTRFSPDSQPLSATIATVTATGLTRAPTADPLFQNLSWLAILDGTKLVPGMTLPATLTLPGEPAKGHLLPAGAIVWHLGHPWVFHETSEGKFERIPAQTTTPIPGGYLITTKDFPTESIVTTGAQLLLSTEISQPEEG